ncbi:MAG: fibronectin type III domain-containing protein [Phycisphaerae bacterium]|nr:fibronectin type III domain-containing protein [Phycisphaerae bacterium]
MKYPKNESDIVVLSNKIISGLATHAADFPNVDPLPLSTAQSEYLTAVTAMETAKATYRQAVNTKNEKLATLNKTIKADLKQAEVDNLETPDNLYEIGWAPKSAPSPLLPPGQVEDFVAVTQGPGDISFKWNKPSSGGKATNYIIARRSEDSAGVFSPWAQVSTSFTNDCYLANQPRGVQLEYTVTATNPAGVALASNTVSAVL